MRDLQVFRDPQPGRSLWELGITLIPFLGLFAAIIAAADAGYLLALALTPLAGLFLLKSTTLRRNGQDMMDPTFWMPNV